MTEERREIPWLPEWKYFVSNLWRVKSKRWIMKFESNKYWHQRIKLYWAWWKHDVRHYQVHRLVYCVFNNLDYNFWLVDKISKCYWLILHKDNDPLNNRLDNLYMWTQKENMRQCSNEWRVVIPEIKYWEEHISSKYTEEQVKEILRLHQEWVAQIEISRMFWIPKSSISSIVSRRIRKHVSL